MKTAIKYLLTAALTCIAGFAGAQDVEMADTFRTEGKIYVVVAIVLIVLTGLIVYLFMLDRKLTKLEKSLGAKNQTKRDVKSF